MNERIGLIIKILMAERGVRQKELAEAIDSSPQLISMYCCGRRAVTIETLACICNYLDVKLSEFFLLMEGKGIEWTS